jgi:hypothetical protein
MVADDTRPLVHYGPPQLPRAILRQHQEATAKAEKKGPPWP